jgi:hypothetical protein
METIRLLLFKSPNKKTLGASSYQYYYSISYAESIHLYVSSLSIREEVIFCSDEPSVVRLLFNILTSSRASYRLQRARPHLCRHLL